MAKEKLIKIQPFRQKWALICGGSKGIGKAVAKEIVKLGGNICIVARTLETLNETAKEIDDLKTNQNQHVKIISCDTTNMEKLKPLLIEFVENNGIPDYLLNFVGISHPDYIEKLSLDDFENHMRENFFGQLNPILTLLPYFIENKKGHIVNASSIAGYIGQMGYTAYTPTKSAIIGLSESLRHELKPYNIYVSIICPPDTETPGLKEELETRPEELNIISESWGGLLTPEEVAEKYIKELLKKEFYIMPGSSKFLWRIMRLFPKLVHRISDRDLRKARKKLGKA
ncbi:MAG: SDR family oxidoreductase [Promethearchaeota archaeon]|jgi:short-subunit dehydrogenase